MGSNRPEINNFGLNNPLRTLACQPTPGLTNIYPQTEVREYPASLRVICGQHLESPGRCWLSRSIFPLQINDYIYSTDVTLGVIDNWLGTGTEPDGTTTLLYSFCWSESMAPWKTEPKGGYTYNLMELVTIYCVFFPYTYCYR